MNDQTMTPPQKQFMTSSFDSIFNRRTAASSQVERPEQFLFENEGNFRMLHAIFIFWRYKWI